MLHCIEYILSVLLVANMRSRDFVRSPNVEIWKQVDWKPSVNLCVLWSWNALVELLLHLFVNKLLVVCTCLWHDHSESVPLVVAGPSGYLGIGLADPAQCLSGNIGGICVGSVVEGWPPNIAVLCTLVYWLFSTTTSVSWRRHVGCWQLSWLNHCWC